MDAGDDMFEAFTVGWTPYLDGKFDNNYYAGIVLSNFQSESCISLDNLSVGYEVGY